MQESTAICEHLEWDSQFFGIPLARLNTNRLTDEVVERARSWCRERAIAGLYFLADSSDATTIRLAESNGYELTDIRVTLETSVHTPPETAPPAGVCIRLCRDDDIQALREIARVSHRDSRFYFDSHFPKNACDNLYQTWIEKSCRGYADAVWVAELESRVAGYLSCHLSEPPPGRIGLFAVHADYRGRRIGQHMIWKSLEWFHQKGVRHVSVVTQGRNTAAQRQYQRCGFLTRSLQLWYHLWLSHVPLGETDMRPSG